MAPFVAATETVDGMELVLLLGLANVAIALAGPGRFSADAALDIPRRIPLPATIK